MEDDTYDYLNQMHFADEDQAFTEENLAEEDKLQQKEKPKSGSLSN